MSNKNIELKFGIGDNVYFLAHNKVHKAVIIGMHLHINQKSKIEFYELLIDEVVYGNIDCKEIFYTKDEILQSILENIS